MQATDGWPCGCYVVCIQTEARGRRYTSLSGQSTFMLQPVYRPFGFKGLTKIYEAHPIRIIEHCHKRQLVNINDIATPVNCMARGEK